MHPSVHSSASYKNRDMEATWMCINRGLDNEGVVHIHNGILLGHKRNEWMRLGTTWMDPEMIILRSDRERKIPFDITYMWNLTNDSNLFTKQKQTQRQKISLWLLKGKGKRDKLGVWDYYLDTTIYKTDNQQGLPVPHKELYSIFCSSL